ncbi:MAG: hypothetical protein Q8P67_18115 [archaeon]|nr:hypothetical protein [archaeon]
MELRESKKNRGKKGEKGGKMRGRNKGKKKKFQSIPALIERTALVRSKIKSEKQDPFISPLS